MGRRETSFLLSMLLVAACTTNPVSGRREVVLMSEEEEQEIGERLARLSPRTGNGSAIAETAVMNELRQTAKLRAGQRIKIAIVEPYLPGSKHERGS